MNIFEMFGKIGIQNDEAKTSIDEVNDLAEQLHSKIEDEESSLNVDSDKASKEVEDLGDSVDETYRGIEEGAEADVDTSQGGINLERLGEIASQVFNGMETHLKTVDDKLNQLAVKATSTFNSFGKGASAVGQSLTNYITKPALTAGAALGGIVLTKGFQRLTGIDTARAKLQGLGHDARTVDAIMDNALTSVKGTAFGMDEAATSAAGAVAAGIEPGKELTRYLGLMGDTAAIAGTELGEMGSIFNKIQTGDLLQAEELNQLGDRGIPIIQLLAEEMGVAEEQVRDLASSGQIGAEEFLNAIEKGFGGAAKIMGETSFLAAWDNVWAAVSRLGAAFLDGGGEGEGFFSQLKPLMAEFTEMIDNATDKAEELGKRFGKAFADMIEKVREIKSAFDALSSDDQSAILNMVKDLGLLSVVAGPALMVIGAIASGFSGLSTVFASVFGAFSSFAGILSTGAASLATWGTGIAAVGGPLAGLGGVAASVGGGFSTLFSIVSSVVGILGSLGAIGAVGAGLGAVLVVLGLIQQQFGDSIDAMLQTATEKGPEIITSLATGIASKIPELITLGAELLTNLLDAITANLPALFEGGRMILESLIFGLLENLPMIMESVGLLIQQLLLGVAELAPTLIVGGLMLLMGLIQGIFENLPMMIETAGQAILVFIQGLLENMPMLIDQGLSMLLAIVDGIIQSLPVLITIASQIIMLLAQGIVQNLPQILHAGIQILFAVVNGIVQVLPQLLATGLRLIVELAATIIANLPSIIAAGVAILIALAEGILKTIGQLLATVPRIFTSLVAEFRSMDWGAIGRNIVNGIIRGLNSMIGSLVSAAKSLASSAWSAITGFFDMRSPSKLTELEGGVMIGRGIINGLNRISPEVAKAARSLAEKANVNEFLEDADLARNLKGDLQLEADILTGKTSNLEKEKKTELEKERHESLMGMMTDMINYLRLIFNKDMDVYLNKSVLVGSTYKDYDTAITSFKDWERRPK